MTRNNNFVRQRQVNINHHDPRHHNEYLLLSNRMISWKNHIYDRSWWLIQENLCLDIFQRYGYDLQSGAWFCLISCQRHGWSGIANSTLKLAEGFNKKPPQSWPPDVAIELRREIIEWYCTHVAICIYVLPLTSADIEMLSEIEGAVSTLQEISQRLNSQYQVTLLNLLGYLKSGRQSLQKRALSVKSTVPESYEITLSTTKMLLLLVPSTWKVILIGCISGIVLTLAAINTVNWLAESSTAIRLNHLWPDNPYTVYWHRRLTKQAANLPTINSWRLINRQLTTLEQRLLDTEQKRKPYMTISELKTEIYQMRQTLQQGGEPVQGQLVDLQVKVDSQQNISDAEISTIAQHLEALNSRFILLTGTKIEKP